MASAHDLLARLTSFIAWHRDQHNPRFTKRHLLERETTMQFLAELESAVASIIGSRQAADQKATAEAARADTAEAEVATLKEQIAADEATIKTILDKVTAENAAEQPVPVDTVTGALGNDLAHEDPALGH